MDNSFTMKPRDGLEYLKSGLCRAYMHRLVKKIYFSYHTRGIGVRFRGTNGWNFYYEIDRPTVNRAVRDWWYAERVIQWIISELEYRMRRDGLL